MTQLDLAQNLAMVVKNHKVMGEKVVAGVAKVELAKTQAAKMLEKQLPVAHQESQRFQLPSLMMSGTKVRAKNI